MCLLLVRHRFNETKNYRITSDRRNRIDNDQKTAELNQIFAFLSGSVLNAVSVFRVNRHYSDTTTLNTIKKSETNSI